MSQFIWGSKLNKVESNQSPETPVDLVEVVERGPSSDWARKDDNGINNEYNSHNNNNTNSNITNNSNNGNGNGIVSFSKEIIDKLKKQFCVVTGKAGTGKAQPINEVVLTPNGYVPIGNIQVGDYVIGVDGKATKVIAIHPRGLLECVKLTFDDNSSVTSSLDHLWNVKTYKDRSKFISNYSIISTEQMINNIYARKDKNGKPTHKNFSIPIVTNPIEFIEKRLVISPYIMGVLLGDGSFRGMDIQKSIKLTSNDLEIINRVKDLLPNSLYIIKKNKLIDNKEYAIRVVGDIKGKHGVNKLDNIYHNAIIQYRLNEKKSKDKFIPDDYLFNSIENRIELLRGLMDTDGYCDDNGTPVFYSTSKRLVDGVKHLVNSLGGVCKIKTKVGKYRDDFGFEMDCEICYIMHINMPINPFHLHRKAFKYRNRTKYFPIRYIQSIEYVGKMPCVCISIDNKDGLYLTKDCIVTHNSTLVRTQDELNPKYISKGSTTGIAAINCGGRTINSLLRYFNTESLEKSYHNGRLHNRLRIIRYTKRVLGIDEMSMLDAKQLDIIVSAIHDINMDEDKPRELGLHLIGDFAQLPPVKAEFCFKARCWNELFANNIVKLEHIYRQDNPQFIEAINAMRRGDGYKAVKLLKDAGVVFNSKLDAKFDGTTLIPNNQDVDIYNNKKLAEISSPMIRFSPIRRGSQAKEWDKNSKGEWGIPFEQRFKIGAYVMILRNDAQNFTYVNGDCGWIESFDKSSNSFNIRLVRNNKVVSIGPVKQLNLQEEQPTENDFNSMFYPYQDNLTDMWVIGSIEWIPLRLAFASTVHKSQGLSLDKLQIDSRPQFYGYPSMAYVAVSRARTPENLVIVGTPNDFASKVNTSREVMRWI